jgi:hypothetical protein
LEKIVKIKEITVKMMARIKPNLKTKVVAHLPYDKETHEKTAKDMSYCCLDDILEWKLAGSNERMEKGGPRLWKKLKYPPPKKIRKNG